MTAEPRYPVALSGGTARVHDVPAWMRLSSTALALLGPLRWMLIVTGRLGRRRLLHRLERIWAGAMLRSLGVRLEVLGLERIDSRRRYVVVPLHESLIDPLVLTRLPLDLSFAARDELFEWRLLGSYLRATAQASVSTNSASSGYRALLRGAQRAHECGESFVIFPQGSILGIEAAFYPGAFQAAQRLDCPVLPIVISGTHRVWEYPYGPTVRRRQLVRLEILDPIPPTDAVARMRSTEREMKRAALATPPRPRRYRPDRDGWWDGYPYRIDRDFEDLADRVAAHRAMQVADERT
ncbi:MAG: lysophospholipid acyltransferase family protein [Actinomycetota bacterium]